MIPTWSQNWMRPGGGGGGIATDKLVWPASDVWLDTVPPGGLLTVLSDYKTGDTYTAKLIAQTGWVQPPADAVAVVNGELRAGVGYASLLPNTYICEIENTASGFTTHCFIDVLSDKAATHSVSTPAQLTTALNSIGSQITAQGAAFTGAIIDIAPGDYGVFICNQLGKNSQTKMVIFRSSDPNRISGARPKFEQLQIKNTRYIGVQNLLFEAGPAQVRKMLIPGDETSSPPTTDFIWGGRNRARGGGRTWSGGGANFVDHTKTINPANDWHPTYTCFYGRWAGGTYTRIDLYRGHLADTEDGAALGVWKAATIPAYVGPNTPDGTARVFTKVDFEPNILAGSGNAPTPPNFDAEYEVAFLTSTPVATINGGVQAKPAGGPDGNYIVAWRLVNGGSPWTGANTSQRADTSIGWVNQASYWDLPFWLDSDGNTEFNHAVISSNEVTEVLDAIRINFNDETKAHWVVNNSFDMIHRDAAQYFWRTDSAVDSMRQWGPDVGLFHCFNSVGRPISREPDWKNPHGDSEQHAADYNGNGSTQQVQPYVLRIGNTLMARSGRLGAGFQGPFMSDMFRSGSGYRLVTAGNFVDAAEPNAWVVANLGVEFSRNDSVLSRFGASGGTNITTDPLYPPATSWENNTFGSTGSTPLLNANQVSRVAVATTANDATVWSAPDFNYTASRATLKARFTGVGAAAGSGTFGNDVTVVDTVRRVWNPNMWTFRLLLPPSLSQAASTLVPSPPRQLLFGTKPLAVSVSGGQWSKGATPALALAGVKTSSPGTLSRGEWIVLWQTTSALPDTPVAMTATIGGVSNTWTARTEGVMPFVAGGSSANITRSSYVSPPSSAIDWTPFTGLNVPAGSLIVVSHVNDGGSQTATPSGNVPWVLNETRNSGTSHRLSVFSWFNDTADAVAVDLLVTFSAIERAACVVHIIPRTTAAARVNVVTWSGLRAATTTPDPGPITTSFSRNYLWLTGVCMDDIVNVTAASAGYTDLVNRPSDGPGGASIGVAERFASPAPAASEDPGVMTISASAASVAFIVGVYETAI